MDARIKFFSNQARIRFTLAKVTMAAKALEARHLCGPTASLALAEGLAAVALMSQDTGTPDEAVLLRLSVSGPIGGVTVEATGAGMLRGFTNTKLLDTLDVRDAFRTDEAWGDSGILQVVTSRPGAILNRASLNIQRPRMRQVLARYFHQSLQIPTACELAVRGDAGGIHCATGLLAQRMEDTDASAFVRVMERFEDQSVRRWLLEEREYTAATLGRLFELEDMEMRESLRLQFQCNCSRDKAIEVLKTLDRAELQELVNSGGTQHMTCHMCGNDYTAGPEDFHRLLSSGKD